MSASSVKCPFAAEAVDANSGVHRCAGHLMMSPPTNVTSTYAVRPMKATSIAPPTPNTCGSNPSAKVTPRRSVDQHAARCPHWGDGITLDVKSAGAAVGRDGGRFRGSRSRAYGLVRTRPAWSVKPFGADPTTTMRPSSWIATSNAESNPPVKSTVRMPPSANVPSRCPVVVVPGDAPVAIAFAHTDDDDAGRRAAARARARTRPRGRDR